MFRVLFFLPFILFSTSLYAQATDADTVVDRQSTEAVLPGDFADPSVIEVNKKYYATGTSSEWAPYFPLYTSNNLLTWTQAGYIFRTKPEWALSSFWAPELFYHRGVYYVYYVARRKSDSVSCIGVAYSTNPHKGFKDYGIVVEYGKEAIDPFVFNDNGQLYITFKAYGLDQRPIEILCAKLSDDGFELQGKPFTLLRDDKRIGLEGQALIKKDNYYYLFYSAGNCCGVRCSYNVRVARASSIEGPYTGYEANPILTEDDNWKCMGHGTLVQAPQGNYSYLHHAYSKKDSVFTGRQGLLTSIDWNEQTGWPFTKRYRSAAAYTRWNLYDDFKIPYLANEWQWDFRHTRPSAKIYKGTLYLTGIPDTSNHTGTAITVRPISGNYEMSTAVANTNASLKGLVLYGDANQSIGIGVTDNKVQIWEVRNNQRSILGEWVLNKPAIILKMIVKNGYECRFFYSLSNGKWWELPLPGRTFYDGRHLPPWDRSPRPGLIHYGNTKEPAAFTFFSLTY